MNESANLESIFASIPPITNAHDSVKKTNSIFETVWKSAVENQRNYRDKQKLKRKINIINHSDEVDVPSVKIKTGQVRAELVLKPRVPYLR